MRNVPHLDAASPNRIPNQNPSWLDFRACGEKIGFHVHTDGRTVRGRENSGFRRGPWMGCRDRALLGQPCFGIGGSNGSYCRVLVGLKIGLGKRESVGEGGHAL